MTGWKLDATRYDEIREEVADFIEDRGIVKYPFSMWALLRDMGIRLVPYLSIPGLLRTEIIEAWPNAVTLRPANFDIARTVIFYNDSHSRERIRFTLAHELAHLILEHPAVENEVYEAEADLFANYLLGPAPLVLRDSSNDVEAIMYDFDVSHGCAASIRDRAEKRRRFGSASLLEYEYRILETAHLERG